MFCTNCGYKLPQGANFCSECGAAVAAGEYQKDSPNVENAKESSQTDSYFDNKTYDRGNFSYPKDYKASHADSDSGENTFAYALLGFFMPIIGLILYIFWMRDYPKRAKSAGKGALISVILAVIAIVIIVVSYTVWLYNNPDVIYW